MKQIVFALFTLGLLLSAPTITAQNNTSGTGIVSETIDVDNYIYMRLEEPEVWVASGRVEVAVGDRISYKNALEMKEFHSSTLDRTFESIMFVASVSVGGSDVEQQNQGMPAMAGHAPVPMSRPEAFSAPLAGEIPALEGGKTVESLFADSAALEGKTIQLRARVIKVSEDIMGKNWITLQDGTGTEPNNKILATSMELPKPGDTVVASGIVRNNIDIGSGYKYKVLLEEASFTQ